MDCVVLDVRSIVRKRPAPEGALRQRTGRVDVEGHVRQKAPGTRKCIKAGQLVWGKQTPNQVRKHPAPEGALRLNPVNLDPVLGSRQKAPSTRSAYSQGLPCGGCQQRRKTASPTVSLLNRPSEPTRITPPPWAPSSSTATKASAPGGFVSGELARFQETSRSRNASTAGADQADANKSGRPRETRQPPTHAHSSPAHERAGSYATRRAGPTTAQPSRPARRPRFRRGAGAGR